MKYIYLDWNVFQHIKHENIIEEKFINGKEFKSLIESLSAKYIFPYSEGHLKDLLISDEKYIKEDLEFIKNISKNYVLGFIDNEKIVMQKDYIEIETFFNQMKETARDELNQEITLNFTTNNHYDIDINQMDNNDLFKPFIEKNNGVLDNNSFANFIMMIYQNIDNPDLYKKFREQVYKLKKKLKNTPNSVIDQQSDYYKELEPFLNFIIERKKGTGTIKFIPLIFHLSSLVFLLDLM